MKVVEAFGWFWKFVFLKPGHSPAESVDTSGRLKPNTCASGSPVPSNSAGLCPELVSQMLNGD